LGGLDACAQSTQFFYEQFYTEAERVANTTRQLTEVFASYGATLPKTREEFRKLAGALKDAGEFDLLAKLLALAPAFASVTAAVEETAKSLEQIAAERESLQRRLYQLTGDTAALRAMELQIIDASNRALQQQIWSLEDAAAAQEQYARALENARSRFDAAASALSAARDAVEGIRGQATSEYLAAQDRVTDAQSRITQILREQAQEARRAAEAMRELGQSLRDFVQGELGNAQQTFQEVLTRALGGDQDAMRALPEAARGATEAARLGASTSTEARVAEARILADVLRVSNMALATALPEVPAEEDAMVAAQRELTVAQAELAEALRVANTINAPLTQTVTDLIAAYNAAVTDLAAAQSEYLAAQALLARIEGNTNSTATNTSQTLSALDRVRAAVAVDLAGKFDTLDTSLDGLLSFDEFKSGFSGLASESTLSQVFRELDLNGDGVIARLEAIRTNTATSNSLLAEIQTGATQTVTFAANDPIRSVFDNISRTNTLLIDSMQLQLKQLLGVSIREDLSLAGSQNSEFIGTYTLMLETMEALRRIETHSRNTATESFNTNRNLLNVMSGSQRFWVRGSTQLFAQGGVFTNEVVNKPTLFDMGMMGEAGPEAIMPLTRLSDGRLGVVAEMPDFSRYGRFDNAEVVAEVRGLRAENAAQARALVQLQQRMTKILERWDGAGIPPERVEA
jgi:hypothetical protein